LEIKLEKFEKIVAEHFESRWANPIEKWVLAVLGSSYHDEKIYNMFQIGFLLAAILQFWGGKMGNLSGAFRDLI